MRFIDMHCDTLMSAYRNPAYQLLHLQNNQQLENIW